MQMPFVKQLAILLAACLSLVSAHTCVFVDPDLLQYDEVWAAAGTWNDNFGANPNDIVRVAGGVVTDLKR